ncbi:hypothetical protein [Curtobacterium sp. MCSS17_005]|uniref:hypothetical protein n=1 Tax=Curtobacterium sp. MCSS17_005 TaxID=2175641 RepID=UPI000DAA4133|nr:hypothetical protein [Curtobacterium sp. MCSS17_005]WIB34381.1 hypothetical protein DEJ20_07915 [Curtobacterium sp. MCSS17_005]
MPKFRVSQGLTRIDIDAVTVVEARAKAVISRQFRDDATLVVLPFDGDRAPSLPDVTPVPVLAAAALRPQPGADGLCDAVSLVRPPSVLRSLSALVALVVLLFAVVAAGITGMTWNATRVSALGDCARIGLCTRTPLSTVEERTGVRLPDGVERLQSSASRDGSYVAALVRLPEGVEVPQLAEGTTSAVTRRAAAALRGANAADLAGRTAGPVGLFTGFANGRTIVFLRYDAAA